MNVFIVLKGIHFLFFSSPEHMVRLYYRQASVVHMYVCMYIRTYVRIYMYVRMYVFSNISSQITGPIEAKFHVEPPSDIWHYSRYGLNPITLMLPVN